MRDFLRKFLYGRYGVDQFSTALVIGSVVLSLLYTISHVRLFYLVSSVLIVYALFRIFSKNFANRQKENLAWLNFSNKGKKASKKYVRRIKDLPHYKYYNCMNCKQTIRVPRGKGRVEIRCPKCGYSFRSKTWNFKKHVELEHKFQLNMLFYTQIAQVYCLIYSLARSNKTSHSFK